MQQRRHGNDAETLQKSAENLAGIQDAVLPSGHYTRERFSEALRGYNSPNMVAEMQMSSADLGCNRRATRACVRRVRCIDLHAQLSGLSVTAPDQSPAGRPRKFGARDAKTQREKDVLGLRAFGKSKRTWRNW